jgi:hypothetical protein
MPRIEMVCLANARKHGGRCVAGIRTDGGGWVRLVSPAQDGTLTCFDYRIGQGDEARPLDVIRAGVRQHRPQPHQRENWVIDETPWELVQRPADQARRDLLRSHIEFGPELFGTTAVTIPYEELAAAAETRAKAALPLGHQSLAAVRPSRPILRVERTQRGRVRLRVSFCLRGAWYDLMCTDPVWEEAATSWSPGEYPWWKLAPYAPTPMLIISLTEPFGQRRECYKIVATIWPGPAIVVHQREQPAAAAMAR